MSLAEQAAKMIRVLATSEFRWDPERPVYVVTERVFADTLAVLSECAIVLRAARTQEESESHE